MRDNQQIYTEDNLVFLKDQMVCGKRQYDGQSNEWTKHKLVVLYANSLPVRRQTREQCV